MKLQTAEIKAKYSFEYYKRPWGGEQYIVQFDNWYGASIMNWVWTYTKEWEFEIAVLKIIWDSWIICYDTWITDDVLWYLKADEVMQVLDAINSLTSHTEIWQDE